jgi:uncharacterized protein YjiS (DUF1127 family)
MPWLLRVIAGWRNRRAARRSGRVHGFIHMSDRMLADIGLRRADVHAALVGVKPLGRPATEEASEAAICRLSWRPPLTVVVTHDLDAAA